MQVVETNFAFSTVLNPSQVLLAIARVWVLAPNERAIRVRALIDPGSTWTFMSRELALTLGVKFCRVSASIGGVAMHESVTVSSAADIQISPTSKGELSLKTLALIVPHITSYLPKQKFTIHKWPHLCGLQLADNPINDDPIHLLIGANLYSALLRDGVKRGSNLHDPVAQETIFGWIISGNTNLNSPHTDQLFNVHHCITNKALDDSLKKFWEIEEVPHTRILSLDDELCEEHFRQTHSRTIDGRYMVRLPFKSEPPINIGSSRHIAEASLKRIESRLSKNEVHRHI